MLNPVPKPVKTNRPRAKKTKVKKKGQKYWDKKCQDLARQICRARGRCEVPDEFRSNHTNVLQWGHIITRGEHKIRFDEDNCLCICSGCHQYYTMNPAKWTLLIGEMLGRDFWWTLHDRCNSHIKVDKEQVYYRLLARWQELENRPKPPSIYEAVELNQRRDKV